MKKIIFTIICLLAGYLLAEAKWYNDPAYKFKVNIPSSWSANSHVEGSDKVYDFYSPDENIAIQIRAFEAGTGVTTELLASVYEERLLSAGGEKHNLVDKISKNGIPGKQGIYTSQYNGQEVTMSAFYAVVNNYGYVFLVIVPTHLLQQKSEQIKQITQTFIVEGFSKKRIAEKKPNQTRLGGISSTVSSEPNQTRVPRASNDIYGKYNFESRSDGKVLVNYHYITIHRDGTYVEKYQPKNSGNYEGGAPGTWKRDGNFLRLTAQGSSITNTYRIGKGTLSRKSSRGITFTFRKR